MLLKKVKFRNFCQHVDRDITFNKGLNVIIGPNGSGKSNILNGIYGALTGDFSRNSGKAAENIALNGDGGESSVDLLFSHGGNDLRILRRLEPADRRFQIGTETYTSDKEVAEKLQQILEVDKEILGQYVFVEQWDNFGPLSLSAAKRISAFQKLFKIEQLNNIGNNLADGSLKLSTLSLGNMSLHDLEESRQKAIQAISDLKTVLESQPKESEIDDSIFNNSNIVNLWARKNKLEASVSTRADAIEKLLTQQHTYSSQINDLKKYLLQIHDSLVEMEDSLKSANSVEASWVKYDGYMAQLEKAKKAVAVLEAEKLANVEPIKPEGYLENLEDVKQSLDNLKLTQKQNQQFIASINPDNDSATCPTCGTPAKDLKDKWLEAKNELSGLADQIAQLTNQISETLVYERQKAIHLSWKENYLKRFNAAVLDLSSIESVETPSVSREEAKTIILQYNTLKDEFIQTSNSINGLDKQLASTTAACEQQDIEFKKESEELKTYAEITKETVDQVNSKIAELKQTKANISKLKTDLALAEASVKNIDEKVESVTQQIKLAALHESWNDRVDNLKKVFKYNALPMVLSYKYMARVVTELNNTLAQIGIPFTIELEQDLSFVANFGRKKVPAARLSGGQKVILTIAYRLAVNFTFATNLGLLCLDEPTVGLDEANLGALEKAFDRLKQFSSANGVQILVVTHERNISHLFDHTIDLT